MYKTNNYVPTDKMSDLICGNYTLLQVMSRFDLSLGFGDQTVQEVCRANGVDCKTFLAVVNFITEENNRMADEVQDLSIHALMNYLKQAQGRRMGRHSPLPPLRRAQLQPRGGGRQPHETHVHRHEAAVPAAVPAGAH